MTVNAKLIRKIREEKGISKDQICEQLRLTPKVYNDLEDGKVALGRWEIIALLQAIGVPADEYWAIQQNEKEYEHYRAFREVKRLINKREYAEARKLLPTLEALKNESIHLFQFVGYADNKTDETLSDEVVCNRMLLLMYTVKSDGSFDENKVPITMLTDTEVSILIERAYRHFCVGRLDEAIKLTKDLIENRKKFVSAEDELARYLATLYFNLSTMLGRAGKFRECADICIEGIKIAREHDRYSDIPELTFNLANAYRDLGETEEIYKPLLIRAYYGAHLMNHHKHAELIKKDAKEDFGILID